MLSRSQQSEMINPSWANNVAPGALTKRMVDVVNQCKYLASKKGMTIKELRRSLREDEARQRQLIRQNEYNAEIMFQFISRAGQLNNTSHGSCHPNWAVHANTDGTLYSHYNVDTYGRGDYSGEWNHAANMKTDISEEAEMKLRRDDSNESMMNLLYFANQTQNDKTRPATTVMSRLPMSTQQSRKGGSSGWLNEKDPVGNLPVAVEECDSRNSVDLIHRPVRKMGSHDLTSLGQAERIGMGRTEGDEDLSYIMMTNEDFSTTDEEADDEEDDNLNEMSISMADDEQIKCNDDNEKPVVSPLLKKVESAFADLQKNDSLFGNMDDFGHLMERIL